LGLLFREVGVGVRGLWLLLLLLLGEGGGEVGGGGGGEGRELREDGGELGGGEGRGGGEEVEFLCFFGKGGVLAKGRGRYRKVGRELVTFRMLRRERLVIAVLSSSIAGMVRGGLGKWELWQIRVMC